MRAADVAGAWPVCAPVYGAGLGSASPAYEYGIQPMFDLGQGTMTPPGSGVELQRNAVMIGENVYAAGS